MNTADRLKHAAALRALLEDVIFEEWTQGFQTIDEAAEFLEAEANKSTADHARFEQNAGEPKERQ